MAWMAVGQSSQSVKGIHQRVACELSTGWQGSIGPVQSKQKAGSSLKAEVCQKTKELHPDLKQEQNGQHVQHDNKLIK